MRGRTVCLLVVLCAVYYAIDTTVPVASFGSLQLMGWLGLLQFALSIYSWTRMGQSLVSPYVVFLCALYVFSFGQSLLYPFGIVSAKDILGYLGITQDDIFHAQTLTLAYLAFFHIGGLTAIKAQKTGVLPPCPPGNNRRLRRAAWVVAAATVVPYYVVLVRNLVLSLTLGYGALYEVEERVGLANATSVLAGYYIPALICLYIAYRDNRRVRRAVVGVLLFSVCAILVTGGRSEGVIILALLLVLHNYLVRPFTRKAWLAIAAGVFVLLCALAVIGATRGSERRDLNTYAEAESDDNPAVEAICEMGGTMTCLIWTKDLVPARHDYRYGKSYLYSFTTFIPNLGFWSIHPAKKEAALNEWLTNTLNLNYGTGFSMCAEAYANFGYFGFLMMWLLGMVASRFFATLRADIERRDVGRVALALVLFWFSLKLPRNCFIGVVRPMFYFALPVCWYTRGYIIRSYSHKLK